MDNQSYKKTIITSALPYINGVKHLGNLIGSLLPADIYARFLRQKGEDVIFICATDEHGAPAEIAAEAEGVPVKEYCDRLYHIQKGTYEKFNLSFDYFGHSSSETNRKLTQKIFIKLYENGHISENSVIQLYDEVGHRFLSDRFVEGTCPHCGYIRARGDQCDNCTKLLDAIDLINPRSAVNGSTSLVQKESKQLFLKLSDFQGELEQWIGSKKDWPVTTTSIAKKWLHEGLKDRCITRDLNWGIPIPLKGYENKVFYVWFDAPNAYIAVTQDWARANGNENLWKKYWQDSNARLVQFLGKDNVPFHTIIWPSIILGSGKEYNLASFIKGFEYLNYEGGKFSTSQKRGIFLDDAIAEFPTDLWRYYLATITPENSDTNFSWEGFRQSTDDLANGFGNFVNRTLTFINQYYEGRIPEKNLERDAEKELWQKAKILIETCNKNLDGLNFQAWVRTLKELWSLCDGYFTQQSPWKSRVDSPEEAKIALYNAAKLCRTIAILSAPLIPEACDEVFRQLNLGKKATGTFQDEIFTEFDIDHEIAPSIAPIFPRIERQHIKDLEIKYRGKNANVTTK